MYDVETNKEIGQYFTTEDARKLALELNALREAAELGLANTKAANTVFGILKEEPKKWYQF